MALYQYVFEKVLRTSLNYVDLSPACKKISTCSEGERELGRLKKKSFDYHCGLLPERERVFMYLSLSGWMDLDLEKNEQLNVGSDINRDDGGEFFIRNWSSDIPNADGGCEEIYLESQCTSTPDPSTPSTTADCSQQPSKIIDLGLQIGKDLKK